MNQHSPLRHSGSLLERAAELYGFGLPAAAAPASEASLEAPLPAAVARVPSAAAPRGKVAIDRETLRERGFILPDAPEGPLAEEFRIVKRQLLLGIAPGSSVPAAKRRTILLCSAQADEGKTFCALNLALSLAGEREIEVLLVDADFPKPEIPALLGVESGRGFADALADPSLDPEALVVPTDLGSLSLLPAGHPGSDLPELLASERTREVLARLGEARPNRIILFDSPPALMASVASILAPHAGQLVMVVRADQTTEADLKEAVGLLSGSGQLSLLLNGTGFAATGRRFGSYYGYGR